MIRFHRPDYVLISVTAALLLFGLAVLASAASPEGYLRFNDQYFFVKKQILLGVLPGGILFWFLSNLDYRFFKKAARPFFCFSLLLLILVLIPGLGARLGGASSWLYFFGFSFQPAELVKLALIVFLAAWLSGLSEAALSSLKISLLPLISVLAIISFLLLKQPDLGSLIILFIIALAMYFAAGARLIYLALTTLLAAVFVLLTIFFAPYRLERLTTFFNPNSQPLGSGYQINQAIMAIGSGGFWGLGWGHSRQKFQYLPEVSADSIFAIMGEELGWLLTSVFIALWLIFFWRSLKIAERSPDEFGKLFVVGAAVWLFGQTVINIGSITGLLPLTGLPLPLVSHGGSALTVSLAALGILVNISKRTI